MVHFPCFPNGFRSRGYCSAHFRAFHSLGHFFECHLCLFYFVRVSARIPGGYFIPLFDFRIFCHSTYSLRFRSLSGRIPLAFYEHFCYSLCFDFVSLAFFAHLFPPPLCCVRLVSTQFPSTSGRLPLHPLAPHFRPDSGILQDSSHDPTSITTSHLVTRSSSPLIPILVVWT